MSLEITFDTAFKPYLTNFTKITLNKDRSDKVATAVGKLIKVNEKKLGRASTEDEKLTFKKIFMELAGEAVMEQFLDMDFVDYNKPNHQTKSRMRESLGGNTDICIFSHGYLPLMWNPPYRNFIFICMISKTEYYLCGFADRKTIGGFSKRSLVLSDRLREAGRVAFHGFHQLKPLPNHLSAFLQLIK